MIVAQASDPEVLPEQLALDIAREREESSQRKYIVDGQNASGAPAALKREQERPFAKLIPSPETRLNPGVLLISAERLEGPEGIDINQRPVSRNVGVVQAINGEPAGLYDGRDFIA